MTTILIVDDEKSMRDFLKILLTKEGYDVIVAGDGNQALTALGKNRVDLVISDIRMPGMGGLELLAKVKEGIAKILVSEGYIEGVLAIMSRLLTFPAITVAAITPTAFAATLSPVQSLKWTGQGKSASVSRTGIQSGSLKSVAPLRISASNSWPP